MICGLKCLGGRGPLRVGRRLISYWAQKRDLLFGLGLTAGWLQRLRWSSRFFCSGLSMLLRVEELEGQVAVGFGSAGAGVVEGYGFAVAGGFGEADVAGDDGLEELFAEEISEVVGDLLGEVGAVVVHGEQDAFEGE